MTEHKHFPQFVVGGSLTEIVIVCRDCGERVPMTGPEWAAHVMKTIQEVTVDSA